MRAYNPKKKHYIYGLDMPAINAGTRAMGRTPISSEAWFELHAVSIHMTESAPTIPELMADNFYINLTDESTGRSLFSEPVSMPAIFPPYNIMGGAAFIVVAANTFYPMPHKPFYLPTPYFFRPGSIIRADLDNRDGAINANTTRIYYHGVYVFDLASPDQSPGSVFAPFTYLATPGAMLTGTQAVVQVATQSDADFDIVSITTNLQTFNESCVDADQAFIRLQDKTTDYQYQDRAISLTHFVGTPEAPYRPLRPIRVSAAGGLQVTIQNNSGVTFANPQIAFNGYKIFR